MCVYVCVPVCFSQQCGVKTKAEIQDTKNNHEMTFFPNVYGNRKLCWRDQCHPEPRYNGTAATVIVIVYVATIVAYKRNKNGFCFWF